MADAVQETGEGLGKIVSSLAAAMLKLGPGELARLRRMDVLEAGEIEYWHLAASFGFIESKHDGRHHDKWRLIVKLIALLCAKGAPDKRGVLHDYKRHLGAVLCDGGKEWPPKGVAAQDVKPVFSEARLARFLGASDELRNDQLESMIRWLAGIRDKDQGVNCCDLAALILSKNQSENLRRIAESYYSRLDKAKYSTKNDKESAQ
jgi:CRISPR system Cascade subunit CasB